MKKYNTWMGVLLGVVVSVFVLSSCGGAPKTAAARDEGGMASSTAMMQNTAVMDDLEMKAEETPAEVAAGEAGFDVAKVAQQNRKLIKRTNLELEAEQFDDALSEILSLIEKNGGYISSQEMYGNSLTSRYTDKRSVHIIARIPAEKLDDAVGTLGSICNVVNKNENVQDVTDSYFDTEARLKTMKVREDRLLALLEQAQTMEDIISLESALSEVRYEIESLTGSLRLMDNQVTYSYLELHLSEVEKFTEKVETPKTLGDKLIESFKTSGKRVSALGESFLLGTIEVLPALLLGLVFWGVVGWLIFLLVRLILRKSGALKSGKEKSSRRKQKQLSKTEVSNETAPAPPVADDGQTPPEQ